jgi:hypothetical protein
MKKLVKTLSNEDLTRFYERLEKNHELRPEIKSEMDRRLARKNKKGIN